MNNSSKNLLSLFISLLPLFSLITAIIHDANHNKTAWVIVDIVIFPLGMLRGFAIWLGIV